MAFPVVEGVTTGSDSSATKYHTITFPANAVEDEYIIGVIVGHSCGDLVATTGYGSTINFQLAGYTYNGGDVRFRLFGGRSLGAGNDVLVLRSTGASDSVCSWITYRISGHGVSMWQDLEGAYQYGSAGWDYPTAAAPVVDDSDTQDYLWLNFAAYAENSAITVPTNFSNQTSILRSDTFESSLTCARRNYNASQYDPASWDTPTLMPNADYVTLNLRVPPGVYPEASPNGFGIFIANGRIGLP